MNVTIEDNESCHATDFYIQVEISEDVERVSDCLTEYSGLSGRDRDI